MSAASGPDWRFVGRGALFGLAVLAIALAAAYGLLFPAIPYGPVPPSPVFDNPPGPLPPPELGLQVWAHYTSSEPRLAGSGFFLELPDGRIIGVTAAHSFDLSGGLLSIGFAPAESTDRAESVALHGEPGRARMFGNRLTGDYLLLSVPPGGADAQALAPDPRGGPRPGERIVVYSGVLGGPQAGAVFRSDGNGAWAVMDQRFDPALSSGAPVLSQHSGQVVGMALVAGQRDGRLVLGMHPIGSIVGLGLAADRRIPLAELP